MFDVKGSKKIFTEFALNWVGNMQIKNFNFTSALIEIWVIFLIFSHPRSIKLFNENSQSPSLQAKTS